MKPSREDYFVLKPKHSAFYSTNLDVLLNDLKIDTLIITGIAGNICVKYEIIVPKDCIASNTKSDNTYALHHFKNVFKLKTTLSTSLKLLSK